jgi:hypothetical protein
MTTSGHDLNHAIHAGHHLVPRPAHQTAGDNLQNSSSRRRCSARRRFWTGSGLPLGCNCDTKGLWLPLLTAGKSDCVAAVAVGRRCTPSSRSQVHCRHFIPRPVGAQTMARRQKQTSANTAHPASAALFYRGAWRLSTPTRISLVHRLIFKPVRGHTQRAHSSFTWRMPPLSQDAPRGKTETNG